MSLSEELVASLDKYGIKVSLDYLNKKELDIFEEYLSFYLKVENRSLDFLALSYKLILDDTNLYQTKFMQNNHRYEHSKYEEVADAVYHNKEYMSKYMYGLFLSLFFWENHVDMNRYCEEHLPKDRDSYLEIGVGHGYHISLASEFYKRVVGVDISETSLSQTRAVLKHLDKLDSNIELIHTDFLKFDTKEKFDTIVMGEVLEHVENPKDFLSQIYNLAKDDSFVYITTAINAPAIDHIYLFEDEDKVIDMCKEAGFKVKDYLLLPYKGSSLKKSKKFKLPMNISLILAK